MYAPLVGTKYVSLLASGLPNAGGKLYSYLAGTTTPTATYTTAAGDVPNANPVVLDSAGRASVFLSPAIAYKFVVVDALGAPTPDGTADNLSGAPSGADLAGTVEDTGADLIGMGTGTYTPGPTVANYVKSYITPLAYSGCVGDGVADDSAFIAAAFAAGKKEIVIPGGYTFLIDGNIAVPTGCRVRGEGTLKKKAGTIKGMLLPADDSEDILIEGITFDGNAAAFTAGNAAMAIFASKASWLKVHDCKFKNVIDVGVKLRNCAYFEGIGNRFYATHQNGIEIDNYDVDPRNGSAWTNLPPLMGGHRIISNWFGNIDDGQLGAGDGSGVRISTVRVAGGTAYPIKGIQVIGNTLVQCLRGIWCENNDVNTETEDLVISHNIIRGGVSGYSAGTYQGIGVVGVRRARILSNTVVNIGNATYPSDTNNGIIVSGSFSATEDVEVIGNTVADTTGNAVRMDYSIVVRVGTNIKVIGNQVSGAKILPIYVNSALVSDLKCNSNPGAQDSYSWSDTMSVVFAVSNIPGTATTALKPCGYADGTEISFPMPVRLVGVSVRLNTAPTTGSITFKPYTAGVSRSNLDIVVGDFGAGVNALRTIGLSSGVVVDAGMPLRMDVVTSGFTPTTADAIVTLTVDTAVKE